MLCYILQEDESRFIGGEGGIVREGWGKRAWNTNSIEEKVIPCSENNFVDVEEPLEVSLPVVKPRTAHGRRAPLTRFLHAILCRISLKKTRGILMSVFYLLLSSSRVGAYSEFFCYLEVYSGLCNFTSCQRVAWHTRKEIWSLNGSQYVFQDNDFTTTFTSMRKHETNKCPEMLWHRHIPCRHGIICHVYPFC